MRVAHIITRLILGGAQENTVHTCEDQVREHGDEVRLISGPAVGPEGSLEPRAAAGGYEFCRLNSLHRSIRPWQDWQAYREIVQSLREFRPDVVHTHSSKAGILGRQAAANLKLPCVHTIHGASFHVGQSAVAFRTYQWLERRAARQTDHFISVCEAMTAQYVAAGVAPAERFTTIYSGFDVERFVNPPRAREDVRRQWQLQPDDIVVGKIGRLFHLKGHEFVIRAAPAVVAANPRVKFLLVGDGILRGEFEQRLVAAGIRDHFVFTGLVPPTQIPELIAAMDLVVHTSEWEGLARVLPQALIAGKPAISYDIDGAREVVIPGVTGVLLPRGAVEPLSAAIVELAAEAGLRERLGGEGRRRFAEVFRHQYMTQKIREVYARVLADRGARPGFARG